MASDSSAKEETCISSCLSVQPASIQKHLSPDLERLNTEDGI